MNINPAWEKAEDLARKAEAKASEPKASAALKASAKALRDKADALKGAPVAAPVAAVAAPVVAAPVVAAPVKAPAKLSLKAPAQAKASNGVTAVVKAEPAPAKAVPVVAPVAPVKASSAPVKAPAAVAAPSAPVAPSAAPVVAFQPFWGVLMLGGGELAPCQVVGSTTVGKGDKARPMYTVDVYGVATDAPDATTVSGMVKRGPVEGFAAVEGGIVAGQHNQTFGGMVVDPDAIMPVKGSTMVKACAVVGSTLRAVWEPLAGIPAIGATVRWFDPYSGAASPGSSRPVDVTITEHRPNGVVVGTVAGWKEPLHCTTTGEGRFYAIPPGTALPMLRDAWAAEWSARAVLHRTLGRHRDWDTMDAVTAMVAGTRTVFPSIGTNGVTF